MRKVVDIVSVFVALMTATFIACAAGFAAAHWSQFLHFIVRQP